MAYLDVITLADAKLHLRVDDTLTEDDAAITRMIKSALSFVENWTSHMVYARAKNYWLDSGYCAKVFDYPINSVTTPASADDYDSATTPMATNYEVFDTDLTEITLNVGYAAPADVPQALIDVALEIIDLMYYGNETGKTVQKDLSPMSIMELDQLKRFMI